MKKRLLVFIILFMTAWITQANESEAVNIFHDQTLQKIYTLQNKRDGNGLLPYFKDKNPLYRERAALAFASIQDAAAITPLSELLKDPIQSVRSSAAYTLGQINDKTAEPILITAYDIESTPEVQAAILEAIGKCGTETGLSFLVNLKIASDDIVRINGLAYGIYRMSLHNVISMEGTRRAVELIGPNATSQARFIAANYLARTRDLDLSEFFFLIRAALSIETDRFTRLALVTAMGKIVKPETQAYLLSFLKEQVDSRMTVQTIRSLAKFEYAAVSVPMFVLVKSENSNVSLSAAEYFQANGIKEDAQTYFSIAITLPHWRSRTIMLSTAMAFAQPDNKILIRKIYDYVFESYTKAHSPYERANLLTVLGQGDPSAFSLLETEAFANKGKIIGTNAMTALTEISRKENLETSARKTLAGIFRKAIECGDAAMIELASTALRDPKANFKSCFTTQGDPITFLTQAAKTCSLPQEIDAWRELQRTIAFFNNQKEEDISLNPPQKIENNPIDWELVKTIPRNQQVIIKTSKGDITVQLHVEDSPGSVSNFIQLIRNGFYKNNAFHRVVPNFVIQDGCPRGDGSGSPAYTIGSEFGPQKYEEGSLGMASAGKDTEGSQWFITHSPTPHLDGRYTIFGHVTNGMSIVHNIEIGDLILEFIII